MKFLFITLGVVYFLGLAAAKSRNVFNLDERSVCDIKKTCFDCLLLPHCSWCEAESKCFSKELPTFEDFCKDKSTDLMDHGFGYEENANCACKGEYIEKNCILPGAPDGQECSGRGQCVCGRCVCNPTPFPEHPTRMVVGEFCEFDNYSCDGPKCNEGPYSLTELFNNYDDDDDK